MKTRAYAKLNLFLEIKKRRKDGYHNLLSLFCLTSVHDEIEVRKIKKPGIRLEMKNFANIDSLPAEKNLAYKAALAFCDKFSKKPCYEITIKKFIPAGAGLGGGSSDCAAVLRCLADMEKINLKSEKNRKKLFSLALELGADVPFFLSRESAAVCSLKGEKIRPLAVNAPMPYALIVWPDAFVSTADVYRNLVIAAEKEIEKKSLLLKSFEKALVGSKPVDFSKYLFNRLESPAFRLSPAVKRTAGFLKEKTGGNALMTGSGGAVFALSYDRKRLIEIKAALSPLHKFIFLAKFI